MISVTGENHQIADVIVLIETAGSICEKQIFHSPHSDYPRGQSNDRPIVPLIEVKTSSKNSDERSIGSIAQTPDRNIARMTVNAGRNPENIQKWETLAFHKTFQNADTRAENHCG